MFDRIPRADADATAGRGVELLQCRRESLDIRYETGVTQRFTWPGNGNRVRGARESAVQMLDWSQGLLRLLLVG